MKKKFECKKIKDNWFSWGWLFFWTIILNGWGGIIYLLIKNGERNE